MLLDQQEAVAPTPTHELVSNVKTGGQLDSRTMRPQELLVDIMEFQVARFALPKCSEVGSSDRFSVALSRLVIATPGVLHSEQPAGKKVVPTTRAAP